MEEFEKDVHNFEPLKQGWFKPRETARYLADFATKKEIFLLLWLVSFASAISNVGTEGTDEVVGDVNIWLIILGVIIFAPLLGYIGFVLSAGLTWLVGKMFGGKGKFKSLFRAFIGASLPAIIASPFYLAWAILEPTTYLNPTLGATTPIAIIAGLLLFVTSVWAFVNQVIAVAEIHEFSIGKAILTILLPIIVLVIIFVVIFIAIIGVMI
jgi:hypothetical protein